MKIVFEDSKIEKINMSSENTLIVESFKSNIEEIELKAKVIELGGIFYSDINLKEIELLVLNNKFKIEEKKVNLENKEKIAIVCKNNEDIFIEVLNKAVIFVDKENLSGKVNIKTEKEIEILKNIDSYEGFIKLFVNGAKKIKIDKSVYEVDFNEEKGIELELNNLDNIPSFKNINEETFLRVSGGLEIIEKMKDEGIISLENLEVELVYEVDFNDGIGRINVPREYLKDENIILEIEGNYKINKNQNE